MPPALNLHAVVDDAAATQGSGAARPGAPPRGSAQRVRIKRAYHFHAALWVYSLVSMLIAIGAFNSQNNLLFWLFGLALSLMIVSGVISGTMMMGLRVERLPVEDVTVGEGVAFRYVVHNRNRFVPAFALTLTEMVDPASPPKPRRWFSRLWRWRSPRATAGPRAGVPKAALDAEPLGFVAHVPPRGSVTAQAVGRASARGRLHGRGVRITTAFPFGIIRKSVEFHVPGGCVVRAAPAALPAGVLQNARSLAPGTLAQPRTPGGGDEFLALRPYQPGDSPRTIAWKASARSSQGDLLVRQTAAPMPLRAWIVLDLLSPHTPAQRERAISLAAGAVLSAHEEGRSVGLLVPAYGQSAPARRGAWHLAALLNDLALLPRAGDPVTHPHGGYGLSRADARAAIIIHAGERPADAPAGMHLEAGPDESRPPGPTSEARARTEGRA